MDVAALVNVLAFSSAAVGVGLPHATTQFIKYLKVFKPILAVRKSAHHNRSSIVFVGSDGPPLKMFVGIVFFGYRDAKPLSLD